MFPDLHSSKVTPMQEQFQAWYALLLSGFESRTILVASASNLSDYPSRLKPHKMLTQDKMIPADVVNSCVIQILSSWIRPHDDGGGVHGSECGEGWVTPQLQIY